MFFLLQYIIIVIVYNSPRNTVCSISTLKIHQSRIYHQHLAVIMTSYRQKGDYWQIGAIIGFETFWTLSYIYLHIFANSLRLTKQARTIHKYDSHRHIEGAFCFTHMRAFIYSKHYVCYRWMRSMRETECTYNGLIDGSRRVRETRRMKDR